MGRGARAAWAALAAIAVLPLSATGAPDAGTTILQTAGRALFLAADGPRVAVATAARGTSCDRIVVWTPATKKTTSFAAGTNCRGGGSSAGEFLAELALAGTRLAWVEGYQGNLQDLVLKTRVLGKKRVTEIAFAENHNGAEGEVDGDYLGHVHGDGSLLVFNTWSVCTAYPAGFEIDPSVPQCDEPASGSEVVERVSEQMLWKITSPTKALVASGEKTLAAQSVSDGNIATLQEGGFAVVPVAGGGIASFVAPVEGIAVSGTHTVILRPDGTLEEVSVESPVPPPRPVGAPPGTTPVLTDLHGLVAVVVAGRKVYLVSLTDGSRHVISVPGTGPIDAELDDAGLFYSYSVSSGQKRGRVAFVPLATVIAQLTSG